MQPSSSWAAALFLLGGLAAQEGSASPTAADYKALVAEVKAAEKVYRAAVQAAQATDDYKAASKAKDNQAMRALTAKVTPVDYGGFTERFKAAADKCGDGDEAVPFLTWIAQNARAQDAGRAAVETLVDKYASSPRLNDFVEKAYSATRFYKTPGEALDVLARLESNSKLADVRAWSMYWHASLLKRGRSATDADKAKADDLLQQARKLAEGTDLADMIDAPTFEAEHLQIGMQAPDIVAADLDGVPFKLSDYRGKVVVLDFWGDW